MAKERLEINPAGIKLAKKSAIPLYTQVYEQFREMILSKRLRPGDRLPASRNLAKELKVSRVIVSQGFEQLMMEGYLIGKTGSGTFVADVLPDHLLNVGKNSLLEKKDIKAQGEGESETQFTGKTAIIPFQPGTPSLDSFPYKLWQQVAVNVLKELKNYNLGYDDTFGYWPLRKAIASYLRISRAVKCEAEQVIIVTGSQQGLNLITACLLQKGDKVLIEDPGYDGAQRSFENAGVELCQVPVESDGLDIAYAIRNFSDAKMIYTTPSHQFPLGHTLSQDKRIQLLAWVKKKNMWIVEDDYDSEFRYEGNPLPSLQGLDRHGVVIYSGTFSKVLFPGLRLAYLVLPSLELAIRFKEIKENLDRQSPIMEQLIVCRFMEDGHFLRHIRKMRLVYAERQKVLIKLISEQLSDYITPVVSPSGMHLLCLLSDEVNIAKFKQEIIKQSLVVSFIDHYIKEHSMQPAILLGYTAFSKYKLKTGVEKLAVCIHLSLNE